MMTEELKAKVSDRLTGLGVSTDNIDETMIAFLYDVTLEHVLNNTYQEELPEGLTYHFIDAICGKYIQTLYLTGKLDGFDWDGAFRSVHLGDTSVELGGLTGADKFKLLTGSLNSGLEAELECYRKLRW